ncbi:VOC family protein [Kribbella qitaiheensis]|uniref:VOC family protein n=1 Tax=Kribbella qitaiheensis TaxID=1544730 RepID=UPI001FE4E7CF|nr:VOC family protein [Kribbella qitaiheensis]
MDVSCRSVMTSFWGRVLGLTSPADNPAVLVGDRPEKTIWINQVSEPRTAKQRVHLDVHTGAIDELEKLGATVQSPITDEKHWAVLGDPEGGEFCGFVRDSVPAYRLMELVVDSVDPEAQARWWAGWSAATSLTIPPTRGTGWRTCPGCRSRTGSSIRCRSRRR